MCEWSTPHPSHFMPEKSYGTHLKRIDGPRGLSGWVLLKRKFCAPTEDRTPDRPAHSKSLHRLCYPVPHNDLSSLMEASCPQCDPNLGCPTGRTEVSNVRNCLLDEFSVPFLLCCFRYLEISQIQFFIYCKLLGCR